MKACDQCAHYRDQINRNICFRPMDDMNPVTAKPYALGEPCYRERSTSWRPWVDRCGPDARYWEPSQ